MKKIRVDRDLEKEKRVIANAVKGSNKLMESIINRNETSNITSK